MQCKSLRCVKNTILSAVVSINGSTLVEKIKVLFLLACYSCLLQSYPSSCAGINVNLACSLYPSISAAVPPPRTTLPVMVKPGGYLRHSQKGNLLIICSFDAQNKSKIDWLGHLPTLTQHRWGRLRCQCRATPAFKECCDRSGKCLKQYLSCCWVCMLSKSRYLPEKDPAMEASVMLFLFPELPAGWEKIEDPVYGVYYVE